jgi:hypothetical protein
VEYAITFFISFWNKPVVAAKAVPEPINVIKLKVNGEYSNKTNI